MRWLIEMRGADGHEQEMRYYFEFAAAQAEIPLSRGRRAARNTIRAPAHRAAAWPGWTSPLRHFSTFQAESARCARASHHTTMSGPRCAIIISIFGDFPATHRRHLAHFYFHSPSRHRRAPFLSFRRSSTATAEKCQGAHIAELSSIFYYTGADFAAA